MLVTIGCRIFKGLYYKTFLRPEFTDFRNKLERLSLASLKPFQSNPMFAGKAREYPSEASFRAPLLASLTNVKLGWKGLQETNTLAYY
jgi:hypothetical protein